MRIANVENSALNWVSISSAGAPRYDALRLQCEVGTGHNETHHWEQ